MSENRRSGNSTGNATKDVYEVRPRKDGHGFYLISERLPFGRLWYHKAADAVDDARATRARTAQSSACLMNPAP